MSVAASIASAMAVVAVAQSVSSQIKQNDQLESEAKAQEVQKEIALSNAGASRTAGEADAEDARRESRLRLGEMRASFGANGIDVSGSPLDVLQDTAAEGELTAQRKEYAGEVQAVAYTNQANAYQYNADVYRSQETNGWGMAFNALTKGVIGGLSGYSMAGGFRGGSNPGGSGSGANGSSAGADGK